MQVGWALPTIPSGWGQSFDGMFPNDPKGTAPKNFESRVWAPVRPLLHVAEPVLDRFWHQEWAWRVRKRRPDDSQMRALLDCISSTEWIPSLLEGAETLCLKWNAEAGLSSKQTYQFSIAESVQFLKGPGSSFQHS